MRTLIRNHAPAAIAPADRATATRWIKRIPARPPSQDLPPLLTDAQRGPFLVDVWSETKPDFWGTLTTRWSWRLIGRDGVSYESGTSCTSKSDALAMAAAIARNEMA